MDDPRSLTGTVGPSSWRELLEVLIALRMEVVAGYRLPVVGPSPAVARTTPACWCRTWPRVCRWTSVRDAGDAGRVRVATAAVQGRDVDRSGALQLLESLQAITGHPSTAFALVGEPQAEDVGHRCRAEVVQVRRGVVHVGPFVTNRQSGRSADTLPSRMVMLSVATHRRPHQQT
jgi:hypothetical protein